MDHVGIVVLCDLNGKCLDLTGPDRDDPAAQRRQRKSANAVKEAAHRIRFIQCATAWATVFVVFTAACTV